MAHMLPDQAGEIASSNTPSEPALEAVRDAESLLRGIYEISKILTAPARLEITLANVANILSSFVQTRHGAIVLLDAEGQPQISATDRGTVPRSGAGSVVPQAVIDKIVATGAPVVIQ
ncbi:MAG: nif-specific transcriptional activator NifA, partial [Mesorhizobium sp.]